MRLSQYFLPTLKENPSEAQVPSHRLLLRAGMIRQVTSGMYSWLPLGLRALQKVENVVREEMNRAGAQEVLMPMVQPAELWQETGRWDKMDAELCRIQDRHGRHFCLGPTHEEIVTDLYRNNIQSYKQFPVMLYQIQTKFRDEIRPRFGLMRGREFMMKDCYSFDINKEEALKSYEKMRLAYHAIFKRLGLEYRQVLADTGAIGGNYSHEFHVLAETGEDDLLFDPQSEYAVNVEKYVEAEAPRPREELEEKKGIEVGHIFLLEDVYSKPMNAMVAQADGTSNPVTMGCYGIGVSRVVAAAIEQNHDDNGIVWPEAITPFMVGIINMRASDEATCAAAEKLYNDLTASGVEVLLDDRDASAGQKFKEMDLIGLPWQCVVGPRGLDKGIMEWKNRKTGEKLELPIGDLPETLVK
ncbi:MAG: prolyl-tRNA synthetase [Alphaproteobacteria bacterium]|jgi:prolyl-tRNA synthetase